MIASSASASGPCKTPSKIDIQKGWFYFSHTSSDELNKLDRQKAQELNIATYGANGNTKFYGNCMACHSSSKSNDFTTVAIKFSKQNNKINKYTINSLFNYIKNPKKYNPKSQMPFYHKVLDDKEICYISSFIQSLEK